MYRECLKFVDRFTALRFTATDESPAARRIWICRSISMPYGR
jgi:hypothetical protein